MLIYELHMLYGLQQHIIFKHYTLPKWGYTYSISEANNPKQWSQWRRYGGAWGGHLPPQRGALPPHLPPPTQTQLLLITSWHFKRPYLQKYWRYQFEIFRVYCQDLYQLAAEFPKSYLYLPLVSTCSNFPFHFVSFFNTAQNGGPRRSALAA